jgi:DNA-binding MarR family transcriptional regulator
MVRYGNGVPDVVSTAVGQPEPAEQDDLALLASAFRIAVMRLSRRLRSERSDDTLGLSQLSALAMLARRGPMSPTALAELERIQPPSMTRVIAALEERSLVERAPHPSDRRQSVIAISDSGRQIVEEDNRRRAEWLAQRVERLTNDERRRLADALPILERIGQSD